MKFRSSSILRMEGSDRSFGHFLTVGTVLACIISVVVVITYIIHFGKSDFSSDDAVLSLQAESMWQQGRIFPEGWVGNNGDLMFPSGTLIIAPLLSWFANGYELHSVVGVFALLLMLGSFSGFLLKARVPNLVVVLAAGVVASGLSRVSAIMLFLQTTYVWWPSVFFLGATLILFTRQDGSSDKRNSVFRIGALAAITFLITLSNPGRAAIMVIVPLYIFDRVLVNQFRIRKNENRPKMVEMLGINDATVFFGLGSAFVLASLFYFYLFKVGLVQTMHNSSSLRWDGLPGVLYHSKILLFGWFDYLGGAREINAPPQGGIEDFLRPVRLVFVIWLSWVAIAESLRSCRVVDPLRSALTFSMLSALIPIGIMYISFSPLALDYTTTRYFTVPILLLLALAAIRVSKWFEGEKWLPRSLAFGFGCLLLLACFVRFVPWATNPRMGIFDLRVAHAIGLVELLEEQNLSWGYATWWYAGVVTVLSDGKVRVNPVQVNSYGIEGYPTMTQRQYFRADSHMGGTFMLLGPGEASPDRLSALNLQLGMPSKIVEAKGNTILVYKDNIAKKISCNDVAPLDSPLSRNQSPGHLVSFSEAQASQAGGARILSFEVENTGSESLRGFGSHPVSVGIRLLDRNRIVRDPDWMHVLLRCAVGPGEKRVFTATAPTLEPGRWYLQANLVQEGIAWFEEYGVAPKLLSIDVEAGRPHPNP